MTVRVVLTGYFFITGDFAMLLKSGMTVKQAYLCNIFSACLQTIGVIIGVVAGNVASVSQWLFAFAGGIFLYVGLVDMVSFNNSLFDSCN